MHLFTLGQPPAEAATPWGRKPAKRGKTGSGGAEEEGVEGPGRGGQRETTEELRRRARGLLRCSLAERRGAGSSLGRTSDRSGV